MTVPGFPRYALAVAGDVSQYKGRKFCEGSPYDMGGMYENVRDMGYMKAYPPYCLKFE